MGTEEIKDPEKLGYYSRISQILEKIYERDRLEEVKVDLESMPPGDFIHKVKNDLFDAFKSREISIQDLEVIWENLDTLIKLRKNPSPNIARQVVRLHYFRSTLNGIYLGARRSPEEIEES